MRESVLEVDVVLPEGVVGVGRSVEAPVHLRIGEAGGLVAIRWLHPLEAGDELLLGDVASQNEDELRAGVPASERKRSRRGEKSRSGCSGRSWKLSWASWSSAAGRNRRAYAAPVGIPAHAREPGGSSAAVSFVVEEIDVSAEVDSPRPGSGSSKRRRPVVRMSSRPSGYRSRTRFDHRACRPASATLSRLASTDAANSGAVWEPSGEPVPCSDPSKMCSGSAVRGEHHEREREQRQQPLLHGTLWLKHTRGRRARGD